VEVTPSTPMNLFYATGPRVPAGTSGLCIPVTALQSSRSFKQMTVANMFHPQAPVEHEREVTSPIREFGSSLTELSLCETVSSRDARISRRGEATSDTS